MREPDFSSLAKEQLGLEMSGCSFVPSHEDFVAAEEFEQRKQYQLQTSRALLDHAADIVIERKVEQGLSTVTVNLLSRYRFLHECKCILGLDRANKSKEMRTHFGMHILKEAILLWGQCKEKNLPLHIVAVGSGGLLNEIFLLALLINQQINNIHLDLVDQFYEELGSCSVKKYDNFHTKDNLIGLIKEFLVIAHFGLGFNISVDETVVPVSDCGSMLATVLSFSKERQVVDPRLISGHLRLRIFSHIEKYALYVMENTDRILPHIIYDIDFEPSENREEMMLPLEYVLEGKSYSWFFAARMESQFVLMKNESKLSSNEDGELTLAQRKTELHAYSLMSIAP